MTTYMKPDGPNAWIDNITGRVKVHHDPFSSVYMVLVKSNNGSWRTCEHRHKTSESAIGHANLIMADWVAEHNHSRRAMAKWKLCSTSSWY